LHGVKLPDRVYGPELTLRVTKALAERNLSIYLYGSKQDVLERFICCVYMRAGPRPPDLRLEPRRRSSACACSSRHGGLSAAV
jgi:hypothetical protein